MSVLFYVVICYVMTRRRYHRNDDAPSWYKLLVLFALFCFWLIYLNPEGGIKFLLIVGGIVVLYKFLKKKFRENHRNNLVKNLKTADQEEYLLNFINRFGLESGNIDGFSFRNYNFDWNRIDDLLKILKEKNVISSKEDVLYLLKIYIQNKEENLTRGSILKTPQKFSLLSGDGFEKLLYMLFVKMGYDVEHIGRSGDQGGDLVANKNGDRVLIQAKCYKDWSTGNAAVQQVVGATKFYDCIRAMVVTTSYFTPQAIALAKANNTELISKQQLQDLLLKFLNESWS